MIGQKISHYQPEADEPLAHNIIEKLGEGGMSQNGPRTLFVSGCRFAPESFRGAEAERKREVLR